MKEQLEKIMEITFFDDQTERDIAQKMIGVLVRETRPVSTDFFQKSKKYMLYRVKEHHLNKTFLYVTKNIWIGTLTRTWLFDLDKCVLLFAEEI